MGFALVSVLPAWLHRRTVGGAAERSSNWQSFRKATRAATYYKRHPITLDSVIELAEFYRLHAEFFNPESETPSPAPLAALSDPLPKTFAINPWFRLAPPVETILDPAAIPAKGCEVLAAPVGILMSLASRRPATPSPGYGIVAFTGISQRPLTPDLRDRMWVSWRAPVFEQFRGFQGELLAWECEAFAGCTSITRRRCGRSEAANYS